MAKVRIQEILSILAIGDGIVAALFPRQHALLWAGRSPLGQFGQWFARRPGVTRLSGAAEAGLGVWWASRLYSNCKLRSA